ncbi:G protein alpha subunit [Ramicandelaber brevisporus]|nr:G protein alpha subunit [Ramicandelaber brevisporus]
MGCCVSTAGTEEEQNSQAIDRQLEDERQRVSQECKILLLGSGESGKSTIVKQMRIIHQQGYTHEELALFRLSIYKNILDSAHDLVVGMVNLNTMPVEPRNREFAARLDELHTEENTFPVMLTPDLVDGIEALWHDPIIEQLLLRSSEFYLMDSAPYFFSNVRRIAEPEYVPTEHDVLRARTKTTGIIETRFKMGMLNVAMFDVGGQRSERKKWIHCFEGVTSVIFCTALSEYDQTLLEEGTQNRFVESLLLFDSIINSRWFLRTSVILFLNKIDIFKEKIVRIPMSKYFPEYAGGDDVHKAVRYILWRFVQLNRAGLYLYTHVTQATDTSNIRLVFAAVKETILQNALRDSGIL